MVGNYSGSLILYTEFIDFILFLIDIKFILSRGNALSKSGFSRIYTDVLLIWSQ